MLCYVTLIVGTLSDDKSPSHNKDMQLTDFADKYLLNLILNILVLARHASCVKLRNLHDMLYLYLRVSHFDQNIAY